MLLMLVAVAVAVFIGVVVTVVVVDDVVVKTKETFKQRICFYVSYLHPQSDH